MELFFADCGYKSSMHQNQCLWFESLCAATLYSQKQYQRCLKELSYAVRNCGDMLEEQYDYYQYALNCGTLQAIEQLLTV